MSSEVYREAALSTDFGEEPMVKIGLSGKHLDLVLDVLIRATDLESDPETEGRLATMVDRIQSLAVPLAREQLADLLIYKIRHDHSDAMEALILEFSRRLGIEIPGVLR